MSGITLTCGCCGITKTFADNEEAFKAGWDEPKHLPSWPISCELCPGTQQLMGIEPWHAEQHELWKKNGRPDNFVATLSDEQAFTLEGFQQRIEPLKQAVRKARKARN